MKKKKKLDKSLFKMTPEELQTWLHFRKAGSRIENRKGKGSYKRKSKHSNIGE
jgi:stalled ribosome alternative rescue factor ArfA